MKWINLLAYEHRMKLLAYIYQYKAKNGGWSPTLQEILDAGFYMSKSSLSYALDTLESDGYIRRSDQRKSGSQMRIEVPGERHIVPDLNLSNPAKFAEQ